MNFFISYKNKREQKRVLALIEKSPACKAQNELTFNDQGKCWINSQSAYFNSGWYTIEDLKEWLNGTGKIVKGETDAEKAKFFEAANFTYLAVHDYSIHYHYMSFGLLIVNPISRNYGKELVTKKITSKNHAEIICNVLGHYVNYAAEDLSSVRDKNKMVTEILHNLYGIKVCLYNLGLGYFGAVNTGDPINLNYVCDLAFSKIIHDAAKLENIKLPDFDFVINYKEK